MSYQASGTGVKPHAGPLDVDAVERVAQALRRAGREKGSALSGLEAAKVAVRVLCEPSPQYFTVDPETKALVPFVPKAGAGR